MSLADRHLSHRLAAKYGTGGRLGWQSAGDKFQGIITLNETGRFIWEKLEEGKNLEEIAETITEEYEVSREKAERDVNRICEQLRELEIL